MQRVSRNWVAGAIGKPGFWLILISLALITLPHYVDALGHPALLARLISDFSITRHSFERILFLAPIVWAGFLFGWVGTIITSLVALACMIPRAVFLSSSPLDSILETGAVFVLGSVMAISFNALRKEREHRKQLEVAGQELKASKEKYQGLFETALDAILVHDLDGNITAANRASAQNTGYSLEELHKMNVRSFLPGQSLELARHIRLHLLANEPVEQPYEQRLIKKDGTQAYVQLVTSVVVEEGKPVAFQHISRDITAQKRMQENLRLYLQETIWAQEEERKRISRELHDDTIQALIVLSRRIDTLMSGAGGLSEDERRRLEELRQQANRIMEGVRRLTQDLRPAALDRLGLMPALEWLVSDVASYSGIEIKLSVSGSERRFSEETELVLFRIVQEALRNVWRHAQATRAIVSVSFDEKSARINIADNGQGFSVPARMGDLAKTGRLGLAGMEERVRLISGTLTVQSRPGSGTSITVELR